MAMITSRSPTGVARTDCDPNYDDIRRALLRFRFDAKYRGYGNRVPIVQFALFCGVTRQTLYHIMHNNYSLGLTPAVRDRLRRGIALVEQEGLRWRRPKQWHAFMQDGSPVPPRLLGEKIDRSQLRLPQPKLSPRI